MEMKGSDIVVECLLEQGVDTVFGYPGGTILEIYDSLYKYQDKINHILTSHEQGASPVSYTHLDVYKRQEADQSTRADIVSIVDIFRAKIVDVSPDSLVVEVTGDHSKINGLLAMLDGFNIVEIVRTGLAGISRGLSDFDIKKVENK